MEGDEPDDEWMRRGEVQPRLLWTLLAILLASPALHLRLVSNLISTANCSPRRTRNPLRAALCAQWGDSLS